VKRFRIGIALCLALFLFFSRPFSAPAETRGSSEEDPETYTSSRVTKTVEGLHFDVDTYVAIKARTIEERLDERLDAFEKRLADLEEAVKALRQRAEEDVRVAGEAARPAPAEAPAPAKPAP